MAWKSTSGAAVLVGAILLTAAALAGCDQPGPLSAAAKHREPPPPRAPAWAAGLLGRKITDAFPVAHSCDGYVDAAQDHYRQARKIIGWAWDQTESRPPERLVSVDETGRIAGFGEGGLSRPDVPAAKPAIRSTTTGWSLVTASTSHHYTIYGLGVAPRSACQVGAIDL